MKKVFFIMSIFMLILAVSAYAGIFGTAKDFILDNALETIITLVFMVIAAFFGGTAWGKVALKAKLPLYEAKDVYAIAREARRPGSPGGKDITPDEWKGIWKQVGELAKSIIVTAGGKVEN